MLAFDNFSVLVHQDQVRDADMTEMHTEGIDPEMIRSLRIARGNVPGHTFIKTELGKKTEGRGQAFFAVSSFLPVANLGIEGILKTLAGAAPTQHLVRKSDGL